jgi:tetratricopeptide (TPR) repeat protein
LAEALAVLQDLGLVTVVESAAPGDEDDGSSEAFLVHRWTARALADLASPAELAAAHQRAAHYWRVRVQVEPQDRKADIDQLLETSHHHHAAGELDDAVEVTGSVCVRLHTWGAWSWEERLCHEGLAIVPEHSSHAAAFAHQLGAIAQERGDYDQALDWYRRALSRSPEVLPVTRAVPPGHGA